MRYRLVRRLCIKYFSYKEGGVFRSSSLRILYRDCKNISAGIGSYGWTGDFFDGPAVIGNYCSLGPGIMRFCKNHISDGVTSHPCWFNPVYGWVNKDPRENQLITIGNDVWIGANVVILPSCTSIGDGCIIAAGSVLTKNPPSYEIWGGVPAKKIRDRFPDEIKDELKQSELWTFPEEKLIELVPYFNNPFEFVQQLKYIMKNE